MPSAGPLSTYAAQLLAAARGVDESAAFRRRLAERLAAARAEGYVGDSEQRRELRGALRALVDPAMGNAAVMVRTPESVVPRLEESGRFKSQFESGSSEGMYNPQHRRTVERQLFGLPPRMPKDRRPIYGYLTDRSAPYSAGLYYDVVKTRDDPAGASVYIYPASASQYGPIAFELRPEALPRTTFTLDDSLNMLNRPFAAGAPLPPLPWVGSLLDYAPRTPRGVLGAMSPYIEAQVHGGLGLEDVRRAHVLRNPERLFDETLPALERMTTRYGWEPPAVRPMPPEYDALSARLGAPIGDVLEDFVAEFPESNLARRGYPSWLSDDSLSLPLQIVEPPWKRGGRVTT